jgi:hypothetical protein
VFGGSEIHRPYLLESQGHGLYVLRLKKVAGGWSSKAEVEIVVAAR